MSVFSGRLKPFFMKKILVIDDNNDIRDNTAEILTLAGYQAYTAENGKRGVELALKEQPDLVICDIMMPELDGFGVLEAVRGNPDNADLPFVFLTALDDRASMRRGMNLGADDFLNKPYHRPVLNARVQSLLKLKGATEALEASLKRLGELQKVRDDLMKMIVHDLKAPLTSILATLEMMRDGDFGPFNDSQARALSDAEGKAEDLLGLIEDLLEVSRIEEETITLQPEPIAPAALLAEIVYDWQLRFQQESASSTIDVSDDAPVFTADKALVKRVISNLVQNAVNHSPGPVRIDLAARADARGILLTVRDDGPGIPAEYQEIIFRKFEQVHAQHAPRVRSSGLGLTFCRLATEAHGGRIWVTSTEGEGSTFWIQLPIEPRPPQRITGRTEIGRAHV